MVRVLSLLASLLLSLPATAAVVPSGVPSFGLGQVGSPSAPTSYVSIPATVQVFSLYGGDYGAASTTGNFYPFYKNGVAYQVTTAKTAYCFNISVIGATANTSIQLVSATASFAFNAGSITGGVYQTGASGKYMLATGSTSQAHVLHPGTYQFGATTYPGFQAGNTQVFAVHMDCYEN